MTDAARHVFRDRKALFVFLLLLLATPAAAAIHEVRPGESIQAAVTQSVDNDTILVFEGVYTECVVLYGKTLTIGSLFLLDGDTSHIRSTVIEPDSLRQDTASCFVYANGEPQGGRLVGLTLRNGRGTYDMTVSAYSGGGLFVAPFGQVLLSHVIVEFCVIDSCSADYGGGAYALGLEWTRATVGFEHCRFSNCHAELFGGGIEVSACTLAVRSCIFEDNSCFDAGGALLVLGSHVSIDSITVSRCNGQMGGLALHDCAGSVTSGVFSSNTSSMAYLSNDFHGTYVDMLIRHCRFGENSSGKPAVYLGGSRSFVFVGNLLEGISTTFVTGTLITTDPSNSEIAYNIFENNVNISGGAIYAFQDSRVRIHHNYFSGNSSVDTTDGSLLRSVSNARPSFDSNFVTGNRGSTITIHPGYPVSIHAENNYWGDPSGPFHATLNPEGRGDTLVGDSVFFVPWLEAPPDTSLPSPVSRELPAVSRTWLLLDPFPNPFNSMITLDVAGFTDASFEVALYNVVGQQVATIHTGHLTSNRFTYTAPASLAAGLYFISARDRFGAQCKKVLLIK